MRSAKPPVSLGESPTISQGSRVPDQLANEPLLRELWIYWDSKRGGSAMPRRSAIAPFEIPKLLPYLAIIERAPDGRFRYRLMGSAIAQAYGFDATGKFLDEVLSSRG